MFKKLVRCRPEYYQGLMSAYSISIGKNRRFGVVIFKEGSLKGHFFFGVFYV